MALAPSATALTRARLLNDNEAAAAVTVTGNDAELLLPLASKLSEVIVADCANGPPAEAGAVSVKLAAVLFPAVINGRWQVTD